MTRFDGPGQETTTMGAVIWNFAMRRTSTHSPAEYEAAEQAYRQDCERVLDAEQVEDEKETGPSPRT